jgi:hypothetical protein
MYISLTQSSAHGFKKWSAAQQPHGNDDDRNVANSDAIAVPNGAAMTVAQPHGPWLVPGMADTL